MSMRFVRQMCIFFCKPYLLNLQKRLCLEIETFYENAREKRLTIPKKSYIIDMYLLDTIL